MFSIFGHVMDTTQIALQIEKSNWWSWPMAMIFHCHIVKSNSIEGILLHTEFELTAHKLNQPYEQSMGGCLRKLFRFKLRCSIWIKWSSNLIFAKTAHFACVIIYFPLSSATAFRSQQNLTRISERYNFFWIKVRTKLSNATRSKRSRRRKEREHF